MIRRTVRLRTTAALAHPVADAGKPVSAVLEWRPSDPLVVSAVFDGGLGKPASWTLGRDLLHAGLTRPAGAADAKAWPGMGGSLFLHLDNGTRDVTLTLDGGRVARFLARTFRLVPQGAKAYDVDTAVAVLLAGGGS